MKREREGGEYCVVREGREGGMLWGEGGMMWGRERGRDAVAEEGVLDGEGKGVYINREQMDVC